MPVATESTEATDAFIRLVRNVRESRFESLDDETVYHAKLRILDAIGCMIAGFGGPGCSAIVDIVRGWGGNRQSTIALYGIKAPAQDAAMVNSILCRSFDFEPVEALVHGRNIPSHITGTTVPTALAVGEWKNVSGRDLITALVAGDDFASRVLGASGFSFDLGWDVCGTINVFGATAIAGKLMGLDEMQMKNAFGIALNQMGGSFQNIYDGTLSFKLPMALSARAGILSAELAAKGYTGIKDPLSGRYGYFKLYCRSYDSDIMTLDLGKKFFSDRTFKPYPACRSTHAAIECALTIVREHDLAVADIAGITIGVTEMTTKLFVSEPFNADEAFQARATFNLRYAVASVLARKSIGLEHFTQEYISDNAIGSLARRIGIVGRMPADKPLSADLEVVMKDGSKLAVRVDVPKGDGTFTPLTKTELDDKFMRNVAFCGRIPESKGKEIRRMIDGLERLENVANVLEELR